VKERVGADPEGLALVDPPNTTALVGRDPVRWTWSRLDERVDVLASFLLARGVQAGDVVAVQLPNCSALVQAFLAIVRIGAVVTPFPVSYREHEMGPMCRRTGAVGVITTSRYGGRELAGAALGLGAAAPTVRFVVARGDDEPAGALAWPEVPLSTADKSALDEHLESLDTDVNDCVTICWTSGTEAEPKAVPRCHGDWLATAGGCAQAAGLTSGDVLLSPFPMTNTARRRSPRGWSTPGPSGTASTSPTSSAPTKAPRCCPARSTCRTPGSARASSRTTPPGP
jgi:acyl-CoA synthetase (AMP-forming)/AMP-acid ligase II